MSSCAFPNANTRPLPPRRIKTLLFLLLLAILAFFVARMPLDWAAAARLLAHASLRWLALHFALLASMCFLAVAAWHAILSSGPRPITLFESAICWLGSNLGKYAPGKVAMLAGRVIFCVRLGVSKQAAIYALFYEHAIAHALALPALFVAVARSAVFPANAAFWLAISLYACLLVFFWQPRFLQMLANRAFNLLHRSAVSIYLPRWALLRACFAYILHWLAFGASGYVLIKALHIQTDMSFLAIGAAFIAAWQIGFWVLIAPGGLGIREGALVIFLSRHMTQEEAVAISIAARVCWILVETSLGALALSLGAGTIFSRKKCNHDVSE